jgi:hypothetical protein
LPGQGSGRRQKPGGGGGQAFEPSIEANAKARMDANKKLQERVGATLDSAMLAYKNAHPN